MPFRFRKSIKIAPGVKLNLSKSGISTSVGRRGASVSVGKRGVRANASIPGTGIGYSQTLTGRSARRLAKRGCCLWPFVLAFGGLLVLTLLFAGSAFAQEDLTPPVLVDVRFEPEVVDTAKGPATITVTVTVTDDLSGVGWVAIRFRKPGTTQEVFFDIAPESGFGELVSGDALSGQYQTTITLRQYSAFGSWEMYNYTLVDNVGNRADVLKPTTEEEKLRAGDDWPALYNGFAFAVGAARPPTAPLGARLYLPQLTH